MINQDEDRNTKNNEQEIKLGYADVSLKTTEYYHDNIIDVYAQISNLTARNADVELKVYEDSLDEILFSRERSKMSRMQILLLFHLNLTEVK